MDFRRFIFWIFCIAIYLQLSFCGPVAIGDVDDERDVNFIINKIKDVISKDVITKDDNLVSPVPNKEHPEIVSKKEELKKSNEDVIRYDSNGNSIESQKAKLPEAVGCHEKAKVSEEKHKEAPTEHAEKTEAHHDESSAVDHHAIRYDKHGNSFEEYKDTEEAHDDHHNEISEEVPKRKKKKSKKNIPAGDGDDTINLNSILSDQVVNKQLQMRELHDNDEYDEEEEEDIPLITIPMVDILRQYQRMQQGYVSETEEYSDETTHDMFADQHLQDILHEISAERKNAKKDKKDGKKPKPAAKRVLERHLGASDESL